MNCPSTLEEITTNVDLSKEAVDHFPPFLRVLDIWSTAEFTRDAWGSLSRFAELKALRINATSITEGETQVLSSLYNLKYLNLFGDHAPEVDDPLPNISESAVCVLAKSLSPHLEEFRCSKKWTNASIFHLVFLCKECEGLKKLAIFWPPSLATTFEQLTKILQLIKPGLIVENLLSDLKRPYESRIPEEYT